MVDMNVVTCSISDALRTDFQGSEGNAKAAPAAPGATKVRDTTVADAGSYVGVVPLAAAANLGTFSIRASNVYTQLVPSAQTETPLVDLKPNGEQVVLSAGWAVDAHNLGGTQHLSHYQRGPGDHAQYAQTDHRQLDPGR